MMRNRKGEKGESSKRSGFRTKHEKTTGRGSAAMPDAAFFGKRRITQRLGIFGQAKTSKLIVNAAAPENNAESVERDFHRIVQKYADVTDEEFRLSYLRNLASPRQNSSTGVRVDRQCPTSAKTVMSKWSTGSSSPLMDVGQIPGGGELPAECPMEEIAKRIISVLPSFQLQRGEPRVVELKRKLRTKMFETNPDLAAQFGYGNQNKSFSTSNGEMDFSNADEGRRAPSMMNECEENDESFSTKFAETTPSPIVDYFQMQAASFGEFGRNDNETGYRDDSPPIEHQHRNSVERHRPLVSPTFPTFQPRRNSNWWPSLRELKENDSQAPAPRFEFPSPGEFRYSRRNMF